MNQAHEVITLTPSGTNGPSSPTTFPPSPSKSPSTSPSTTPHKHDADASKQHPHSPPPQRDQAQAPPPPHQHDNPAGSASAAETYQSPWARRDESGQALRDKALTSPPVTPLQSDQTQASQSPQSDDKAQACTITAPSLHHHRTVDPPRLLISSPPHPSSPHLLISSSPHLRLHYSSKTSWASSYRG